MVVPVREFRMTRSEFGRIRDMVREHTGITLSESKFAMVYSRLAKRLRKLGMRRFSEYLELLESDGQEELVEFVSAITTNLTHFFREEHHFERLEEEVLPRLLKQKRPGVPIRIWSAGCSTGMEPYSIAIVAHEVAPNSRQRDVEIFASDIDRRVLDTARRGVYEQSKCTNIDPDRMKRWFQRGTGRNHGMVRVADRIRSAVRFLPLNLVGDWRAMPPVDVIFCRNVLIYFDPETQREVIDRFAEQLSDDGMLFLGHSESLYRKSDRFESLGKTTFRKVGRGAR